MSEAIDHEAEELTRKVRYMILKWRQDHRDMLPQYLFLSRDAISILSRHSYLFEEFNGEFTTFMGITIAFVEVPGVYAGIGEQFN